jgi:hypothetical protein
MAHGGEWSLESPAPVGSDKCCGLGFRLSVSTLTILQKAGATLEVKASAQMHSVLGPLTLCSPPVKLLAKAAFKPANYTAGEGVYRCASWQSETDADDVPNFDERLVTLKLLDEQTLEVRGLWSVADSMRYRLVTRNGGATISDQPAIEATSATVAVHAVGPGAAATRGPAVAVSSTRGTPAATAGVAAAPLASKVKAIETAAAVSASAEEEVAKSVVPTATEAAVAEVIASEKAADGADAASDRLSGWPRARSAVRRTSAANTFVEAMLEVAPPAKAAKPAAPVAAKPAAPVVAKPAAPAPRAPARKVSKWAKLRHKVHVTAIAHEARCRRSNTHGLGVAKRADGLGRAHARCDVPTCVRASHVAQFVHVLLEAYEAKRHDKGARPK